MKKYLSISFFIVLLDQLSKIYIKFSPTFPENTSVNILGSFFRISFFFNDGLVFGISVDSFWYWVVIFLSICIIGIVTYEMSRTRKRIKLISYSLILAGAIGNIIDRMLFKLGLFGYEGVVDFISIGFGENYRFPWVFNIADASVTIGIVLFLYYNYIQSSKPNHDSENRINDEPEKI